MESFEKPKGDINQPKENKTFSPGKYLEDKYPDLKKPGKIEPRFKEDEENNIAAILKKIKEDASGLTNSEAVELSHDFSIEKEKIPTDTWLKNIENFHKKYREDPEAIRMIKEGLYDKYVIKPENIPESYFKNQQRMARELGRGEVDITEETRNNATEIITSDQKSTLDNWSEYLLFSKDADIYPMWAKYWTFRSMLKLSSYDKEKKSFGNRREDTVAPFPDLDREALAYVMDIIVKKAEKANIKTEEENSELQKLIESENFGKLYAYAIEKVTPSSKNELEIIEGEWVRYPQGSDHMPLVNSLQGHGTGWCTAGESTAKTQLERGDFYVYYSKNIDGISSIPRAAIRMEGMNIGEVRGVGPNQNLDPYIGETVKEKLAEFPDAENYTKKTEDMKLLTLIDNKQNNNQELSKEELSFLYELNKEIEGFGYKEDPRIKEIKDKRDAYKDISSATGFEEEQISFSETEALKGNIKLHYGNLDFSISGINNKKNLMLPENIIGNLDLSFIKEEKISKMPQRIKGYAYFNSFEGKKPLNILKKIKNTLGYQNKKLELPERIGRDLFLNGAENVQNLKLPKYVGGNIHLSNLRSARNLELPEYTGGDIHLEKLQDAEGLILPKTINGSLLLNGLQSAKGLNLPENIKGGLNLDSLQSARDLKLPKYIGGIIFLNGLKDIEGLELPENVGNHIIFLYGLDENKRKKAREKYPNLKIRP